MLVDRFIKVSHLAIIILLIIILVKPIFEPEDSYASKPKTIEYKVIHNLPDLMNSKGEQFYKGTEEGLNKYGAEGWELIEHSNRGWAILIRR